MAEIAFFGLGRMGSGMASSLARAGHQVRAFDLFEGARNRARGMGLSVFETAAEAAEKAEYLITALPAGQHVQQALSGPRGLWASAPPEMVTIDCSTISPTQAQDLHAAARAKGRMFADAPVSGGTVAASNGTLTFMVGAEAATFDRIEPILQGMGKTIIHAGGAGAGQAAKVCNNMLMAISMIGTCEAFALAERLGLDRQRFFEIASQSSGQCWSMTSYCPVPGPVPKSPANHDYQAGFATAMMLKDLRLAVQSAADTRTTVPLGSQAESLFALFAKSGGEDMDFSAIYRWISNSQ